MSSQFEASMKFWDTTQLSGEPIEMYAKRIIGNFFLMVIQDDKPWQKLRQMQLCLQFISGLQSESIKLELSDWFFQKYNCTRTFKDRNLNDCVKMAIRLAQIEESGSINVEEEIEFDFNFQETLRSFKNEDPVEITLE